MIAVVMSIEGYFEACLVIFLKSSAEFYQSVLIIPHHKHPIYHSNHSLSGKLLVFILKI